MRTLDKAAQGILEKVSQDLQSQTPLPSVQRISGMIETAEARAKRIKSEEKIRAERAAAYAAKQAQQHAEQRAEIAAAVVAIPLSDPNAPLTPLGAKSITKKIRDHLEGADSLILEAYNREAWKALKYDTWEAYVKEEFAVSRSRSYQLINFTKTVELLKDGDLSTLVDKPESERQTRELNGLSDGDKKKAWKRATKAADGQPTPKQVRAAVNKLTAAKATVIEPSPAAPLAAPEPIASTISNGELPPAANLTEEDRTELREGYFKADMATWEEVAKQPRTAVKITEEGAGEERWAAWFTCPECQASEIADTYHFCPMCGVPVEFEPAPSGEWKEKTPADLGRKS